jgi:organic radical activating enzyme
MQPHKELHELVHILIEHGITVEVFTNGTYDFPEWVVHTLQIMMDWKLAGSGEAQTHRRVRFVNLPLLKTTDGLKFVVASNEDLDEAREFANLVPTRAQLWVGAAWGKITDLEIIEYVKQHKLPWRLNVQTHKHIWEPTLRGV